MRHLLFIGFALVFAGCTSAPLDYVWPASELVLSNKEEFPFTLPAGSGKIIENGSHSRTVIFNGQSHDIDLYARHSRFWGRMGAYNPAARLLPLAQDDMRIVYDEAELKFSNKEDIQSWLNGPWNKTHGRLTGDTFCLVCAAPSRRQITIELYRIIYSPKDGFPLSMFWEGKMEGKKYPSHSGPSSEGSNVRADS